MRENANGSANEGVRESSRSFEARPLKFGGIFLLALLVLISDNVLIQNFPLSSSSSSSSSRFDTSAPAPVAHDIEIIADDIDVVEPANTHSRSAGRTSPNTTTATTNIRHPPGDTTILSRMQLTHELPLSVLQQASLETKRRQLRTIFPLPRRFPVNAAEWAANLVTPEYAYLHIYKNGGTTVAAQTQRGHVPLAKVQKHQWFTFVRDPIDHFLSGWSECGHRSRKDRRKRLGLPPDGPLEANEIIPPNLLFDYDMRVSMWLKEVQSKSSKVWHCNMHSFPQVNYMLNRMGMIAPQLQIVGDLREVPGILRLIGFKFNDKVPSGRNSTADTFLTTYYPRRVDLLSNETLRRLCDYLAIDYYLLDYAKPEVCDDMPVEGYTQWSSTTHHYQFRPDAAQFRAAKKNRNNRNDPESLVLSKDKREVMRAHVKPVPKHRNT